MCGFLSHVQLLRFVTWAGPVFFGEKGNFFTGGAAEKNFDIKAGGFLMMEKDSLCLR
jgi:hypothetical protein